MLIGKLFVKRNVFSAALKLERVDYLEIPLIPLFVPGFSSSDKERTLSEVSEVNVSTMRSSRAAECRSIRLNFEKKRFSASENQSHWTTVWRCLRDPMCSRFDTIPACDRQTQTDTQTDTGL